MTATLLRRERVLFRPPNSTGHCRGARRLPGERALVVNDEKQMSPAKLMRNSHEL